jgi:hypothetical protein
MSLYLLIPFSHRCSILCCPPLLLAVFLSVLRCGGSLIFRRRAPFLHPGPCLIPLTAKSFDDTRLSWIRTFLVRILFHHATVAWRDILISTMANSLRCPQISWVPVLRKIFLFRHTIAAWQDTFLQAAANFLRDLQFPRVSSFGSPRHPAVDFQPLRRCFSPLTGITATSSLRIS